MKIGIGSDHRGFDLKRQILDIMDQQHQMVDIGCFVKERCDYPDIVLELVKNNFDFGILICHTGIGMSVCANKYPSIRAALCVNEEMALSSREHTDCNVLVLPSAFVDFSLAFKMIHTFVTAEFCGGVYKKRIEKLPGLLNR